VNDRHTSAPLRDDPTAPDPARVPRPAAGAHGLLITFEGIDRCGKSTQVLLLRDALLRAGLPVGCEQVPGGVLREPGDTPAGERIRDLLLHEPGRLAPWTEAALYAAARAELAVRVLKPSLQAGWVVLLDRYVDSSLAYQGHARGLGVERVLELNDWATGGLMPDLTFLVQVTPEQAARRAGGPPDRIEREGLEFQQQVAEGYAALAAADPQRFRVVDGVPSREAVAAHVERLAKEFLEALDVR
jgi:dTMP kinase